jgi:hypothetical protein
VLAAIGAFEHLVTDTRLDAFSHKGQKETKHDVMCKELRESIAQFLRAAEGHMISKKWLANYPVQVVILNFISLVDAHVHVCDKCPGVEPMP